MSVSIRLGNKAREVFRNRFDRMRLKNRDISIISNHCMGGIIYHDLGLRFLSPTINLKILPDEFIVFVENLPEYLKLPLIPAEDPALRYPVGKLAGSAGEVTVYFVHYKTFEQANASWESRKSRVNFDNLHIMMTIRDGCREETIERFSRLPYECKVLFADEPHPECPCAVHARLPGGRPLPGYISDVINVFGKRAYQCDFDYIAFLNHVPNDVISGV